MFAVIAAFYPGMVDRFLRGDITDVQIEVLLRELGYVRFLTHQAQLRASFSKLSDEDCEKMISGSPSAVNPARKKAWELFAYAPYGLLEDEQAPGAEKYDWMPASVAEAICQWWERGDCPDWAWLQVLPHYARIVATADA